MIRIVPLVALVSFAYCLIVPIASSQTLDSTRVYELQTIVKTAEREGTLLARTTSATSVLRADGMRAIPAVTIADVLAATPGMTFFDLDGLGYAPQPVVRGFYGGGEAEYVQLLIDDAPVSSMESGLVNWHLIPVAGISSLEILRGGSSALYGDAAVGAVINVEPRGLDTPGGSITTRVGTYVPFATTVNYAGKIGARRYAVLASYDRIDGYREHNSGELGSVGGRINVVDQHRLSVDVSTIHYWQSSDLSGPTFQSLTAADPKNSLAFFRYDATDESWHRAAVSVTGEIDDAVTFSATATPRLRKVTTTETLPLAAQFADTQSRDLTEVGLNTAARVVWAAGDNRGRLIGGLDLSAGRLDTEYAGVIAGTLEDYAAAPNTVEPTPQASGNGSRIMLAGYGQYDIQPIDWLRILLGTRIDVLRDRFSPDDTSPDASTTHTAVSPRLGVNVRVISTPNLVTNIYGNLGRSFKAPTFDQLFDLRAIPVPFPPFQISISSQDLKPQYGTSVEVGLYHIVDFSDSAVSAELSAAVYNIEMIDEIDFDLQSLTYRNLGKSRHRGVESELKVYAGSVALRGGYTYQETQLRFGEHDGNFVKAVPRDIITAGATVQHRGLSLSASLHSARRMFIDDANLTRLPNYSTVNARAMYDFGRFSLTADLFNLFDEAFASTGFPDPAGSDAVFVYPSADRHARLGVMVELP